MGALREPPTALEAIRRKNFFTPDGPRREEILFMGDLLRQEDEDVSSHARLDPRPAALLPLPPLVCWLGAG